MSSEIVMRSSYGSIVYISMVVTFLAFMPLIVMLPQLRLISIVALVALMVSIGLYPFMIKYKFDDEKVSISNPLSWNEPPAYYDRIYKVIDTDGAYISNHHGTSPDSIQIWYDGGTGHYICISPYDKKKALAILEEKCKNAKFEVSRKE